MIEQNPSINLAERASLTKKLFVCFICCIAIAFSGCMQNRSVNEINPSINQWALVNHGQMINGTRAKRGLDINIQATWQITTGDPSIIVAVVDTGIYDVDAPSKSFNSLVEGWDFYHDDSSLYDGYLQDYHGTYVAGIIAGNGYPDGLYGIAPDVTIMPVKFMRGSKGNSDDAADAIRFACENGARIINCSWSLQDDNPALASVIQDYPSVLFVCAAGNTRSNLENSPIYPAAYQFENILTVIAVDHQGEIDMCSGYGHPCAIAAPGADIAVRLPDGDSTYIDGTSAAAAMVSGVAALMLSVNPMIQPCDLIEIMIRNASPVPSLVDLCRAGGLVNAGNSIHAALNQQN